MTEKCHTYSPLIVIVALNASFTLLLMIFAAHQQIELVSLRDKVNENTQNKADKLGVTSEDTNCKNQEIKLEANSPQVLSVSITLIHPYKNANTGT